jgi:hypothetical protein
MIIRLFAVIVAISLLAGAVESAEADAPASTGGITMPALPPSITAIANDPIVQSAIGELKALHAQQLNTANGTVCYFHRYDLQVQTGTDTYRDIHLHQGTVIYPRGAKLGPGMAVVAHGASQPDGSLDADMVTVKS